MSLWTIMGKVRLEAFMWVCNTTQYTSEFLGKIAHKRSLISKYAYSD